MMKTIWTIVLEFYKLGLIMWRLSRRLLLKYQQIKEEEEQTQIKEVLQEEYLQAQQHVPPPFAQYIQKPVSKMSREEKHALLKELSQIEEQVMGQIQEPVPPYWGFHPRMSMEEKHAQLASQIQEQEKENTRIINSMTKCSGVASDLGIKPSGTRSRTPEYLWNVPPPPIPEPPDLVPYERFERMWDEEEE